MRLSLLILLFVLLIPAWNVLRAEVPYTENSEREFKMSGRPFITVRNPDGNTILESANDPDVRIEVIKEVRHAKNEAEAKKYADRVTIRLHQVENKIEIEAIHPRYTFFNLGNNPQVVVNFHITAPRSSDITASGSDGKMDVRGFEGTLQLTISDGNLTAKDLSGKLKIAAADGNINVAGCTGTIEFRVADGDLNVEQCSGDIQASSIDGSLVMNQIKGSVGARTVDGKLLLNGTLESLNVKATDGYIDVRVNNGSMMQKDWLLKSSDGNISLHLPESFSADLDISSSDGHIETRKPILIEGSLSNNKIMGKMGNGGHLLKIHTRDGNVQILNDGQ